ncbi:hypothetical protein [Streptomyces yerevanensis]|uniref:hypothetical protein n=1 Tax=Streptomyces yerevanensis TaxID=66378 RepID=UPI001FDFEE17|nr:hypothetical protein [Streptomyces yerevanensis]
MSIHSPNSARRTATRAAVLAAACLAVALSSGCTKDDAGREDTATATTGSPSAKSSAGPAKATERAEHIDGETVTEAPGGVDGEVIASVADARGNQVVPLEGGVRTGPVSIAVNCQGEGTLTVELKSVGLSFPLKCVADEVSSTYNQVVLEKADKDAVLQVTAQSGVRWALSVGQ